MADNALNFDCDWRYALNLQSMTKATVGYLLDWTGCGGLNLKRDIEVFNPCSADRRTVVKERIVRCIGLIEAFRFDGGENDPIHISAFLSKGMASEVQAMVARPITTTKVQLSWLVMGYDEERKQWYEAAFCKRPSKAEANLNSGQGELQIFVDNQPTLVSDTLNLHVYRFEFEVVPADKKTSQLEFATGPMRKLVTSWSGD